MLILLLVGLIQGLNFKLQAVDYKCWGRFFIPPETKFKKNNLFTKASEKGDQYGPFEIPNNEAFFFLFTK